MHPIRLLLLVLRRARTHGLLALGLLFVFVIVSATFGFIDESREYAGRHELSWHEALYDAIGLFPMAGNRFNYPHSFILRLDYFLAPVIAASAVFGAFARILEERAPLFLRRFRHHTVIGGLGRLGMTVARHEHRRRHFFVALELNERAPQVVDAHGLGTGIVLLGDMTSAAFLQKARVQHARRIFFTASSDVANLDAAFKVRSLCRAARVRTPPTVFVHVFDTGLQDSLGHHLRSRSRDEADIIPFNSYRFAAKALLAILVRDRLVSSLRVAEGHALIRTAWPEGDEQLRENPATRDAALAEDRRRLLAAFRLGKNEATEAERFAIVGMGRLGHALAKNILDHAPNPRFLVIERAQEKYRAQVDTFEPEERDRFESFVGDATDKRCIERIDAYKPKAALICTDNDLGNLRLALDLHTRNVRTVTRIFDLEASSDFADGLKQRGIATASLQQLFHAAIPILMHERRLLACVNLDASGTQAHDHLFYFAKVTLRERQLLGDGCVGLDELERDEGCPDPPDDLVLVWHRSIEHLDPHAD